MFFVFCFFVFFSFFSPWLSFFTDVFTVHMYQYNFLGFYCLIFSLLFFLRGGSLLWQSLQKQRDMRKSSQWLHLFLQWKIQRTKLWRFHLHTFLLYLLLKLILSISSNCVLTVINASAAVTLLEQRPEKIQALSEIRTHDLCDARGRGF